MSMRKSFCAFQPKTWSYDQMAWWQCRFIVGTKRSSSRLLVLKQDKSLRHWWISEETNLEHFLHKWFKNTTSVRISAFFLHLWVWCFDNGGLCWCDLRILVNLWRKVPFLSVPVAGLPFPHFLGNQHALKLFSERTQSSLPCNHSPESSLPASGTAVRSLPVLLLPVMTGPQELILLGPRMTGCWLGWPYI